MEGYCVYTYLIDDPAIYLYYKGMENDESVVNALNVVVTFTSNDAMYFDEATAISLCERLNKDSEALKESGYSEFKIFYRKIDVITL